MEFSVKSNVISLGDLKRKVSRVAQSCVKISICQIMRGEITFRLSLNSTNFVSFTFFIDFFFLKQLSLHTGTFHSWYFTVKHIIRPKSVKKKCTKSNKYLQTKYIFPSLDIIMLWLCTKSHLHEIYRNTASTNALKGVNNHDSCFFSHVQLLIGLRTAVIISVTPTTPLSHQEMGLTDFQRFFYL